MPEAETAHVLTPIDVGLLVFLVAAFQLQSSSASIAFVERVEQPGGLQIVDARQVAARDEAEVGEELGAWSHRATAAPALRGGPAVRTQPASISTSSVPLEICTPRIASISARLTGS